MATKAKTLVGDISEPTTQEEQEQPEQPTFEASEEQKQQVSKQQEKVGEQSLETLAGLVTIETGLNQQLVQPLKLNDDDRELVNAALDVLAEVIERKVTTESTKRYLGLLLVFIRSALAI